MNVSRIFLASTTVICILAQSGHALATTTSLAKEQQTLKMITTTADSICARAAEEGSINKTEVSGTVNFELSRLFRRLAKAGVDVSANHKSETYRGVLQNQVLDAAREADHCKTHVFDVLTESLLPNERTHDHPTKKNQGNAPRTTTGEAPESIRLNNVATYAPNSPAIGSMSGGTINMNGR